MTRSMIRCALVAIALCVAAAPAEAQRRRGGGGGFRGGGGGFARASARPSVSVRRASVGNVNRATVNRNVRVNRAVRVNDVHVDRDWDDRYTGCCYRPVARTAARVGAAAAVGAAVYSLPSSCVSTTVNGVTYMQCGNTWYRPEFSGTNTTYVVVSAP